MSWKSPSTSLEIYRGLPAFRRLYRKPGAGMPALKGEDVRSTPAPTVIWWSHKDPPIPEEIGDVWSALASRYPEPTPIRWTFQHEAAPGEQLIPHREGWQILRDLKSAHPDGARIRLVGILGGYWARYKSAGYWRDWVLPGVMDEVSFDLYTPTDRPSYEDPGSLLGIAFRARAECGLPVSIGELGSVLLGRDKGPGRAAWLNDCLHYAQFAGVTAVGLWNSSETRDERYYDYRLTDHDSAEVVSRWFEQAGATLPPGFPR